MAGGPEPQPVPNDTAQIKAEVQAEIDAADTPAKKVDLAKKLIEDLKDKETHAKEVISEETDIKAGQRLMPSKQIETAQVFKSVLRAAEAAKKGIPVAKDNAQKLLAKLADQSLTPSTAAAIEVSLLDYFTGKKDLHFSKTGQPKTDFEKDFERLKAINPLAAELIARSIISNPGEFGLTEDEAKEKFRVENISEIGNRNKGEITLKDLEERKEIYLMIDTKLREAVQRNLITPDERNVISGFLFNGEVNDEILQLATKIGISPDLFDRFSQLTHLIEQKIDFGFIESYAKTMIPHIRAAQEDFSLDNLKQFFKRDEKGNLIITEENKQKLKDMIRKYYYIGLKRIHEQSAESFHKVMSEHQEVGYYLMMLRQVIEFSFEKIREVLPEIEENEELKLFLTDITGNFQMRIYNWAEAFHDMPLLVRDLGSTEKVLEFLKFIYPTQLAEIFHEDKLFMTIARDEMTMHLREYLVGCNNAYDGSLLSGNYRIDGARWTKQFREDYIKRLKKRFKLLGEEDYLKKNEWKLEMIATYSEGIGIATLIDGEILATSDPVSHIREVHPLMSLLSAKHNFGTGRARKIPGLISKYFLGMPVTLFPKERSWWRRMFSKRKWDPTVIKEEIDRNEEVYGRKVIESLFSRGGLYQSLLSMLNLPNSFNSWDGWRVEQIPKEFSDLYNRLFGKSIIEEGSSFINEDWKQVFDIGLKLYGTSFLWWSIKGSFGRLTAEVDKRLESLGFSREEIKKIKSLRAVERIIDIDFDGRQKVNFIEFQQIKLDQRRGELYFRYLQRNPGDFLMVLHQICPEVFIVDNKGDNWMKNLLFEFDPTTDERTIVRELTNRSITTAKDKINLFLRLRKDFLGKWGKSFDELKELHQWIERYSHNDKFFKDGRFDKMIFIKHIEEASATAYARLKRKNEKTRQEILYSNLSPDKKRQKLAELRSYLRKEDFEGFEDVWEMYGGENGLFKALTGLNINDSEEYFKVFGGVDGEGRINIFFNIAHNWYLDKGDINPFAADIPYLEFFRNLTLTGESNLKRTFEANITTYKEIVSKVGSLEELLINAAKSHDFTEINKLHEGIYKTLSGLVSQEYAWEANYILSQIVTNFFAEHSILRDPKWKWLAPVAWVARLFLGKNVSLSKLLTRDRNAYSMDTNAMKTYFEYLRNNNLINPDSKGPWGMEQLNKVFEASSLEFAFGDVIPQVLWTIAIFMFFVYLKKALEEMEGKKK